MSLKSGGGNKMNKKISVVCTFLFTIMIMGSASHSDNINFVTIEMENVSRYNENRIAFQHIEETISPIIDNSLETLLIIKDKKMYLIKDGYDSLNDVQTQKMIYDMENRLYGDLWINKLNSKPDYVKITERRVEVMKKIDEEFVTQNFGNIYKQTRDMFVKKHIAVFLNLMTNRDASELHVERTPIPKHAILNAPENEPTLFATSAYAKSSDGKIYFCEDADGDGVTETFSVSIADGFNWGYQSGPNVLFIFKNKQDDLKEMIKDLSKYAYYGTPAEESAINQEIKNTFNTDQDIKHFIDDIIPEKVEKQNTDNK